MNVDQVNTLGGLCELVGVGFVTRDLMALAHYRGVLERWAARSHTRWAAAVAAVRAVARRMLRRSHRVVLADAGVASTTLIAGNVTGSATGMRGPFTPRPGQSLQDQIAELGLLVNRLREEIVREPQERARAIAAEREARREELRAERERLERLITTVRQEVEKLRDVTTGDLVLRVDSLLFLLAGILLTTWPHDFAKWLPTWPPFPVAAFFVGAYLVVRFSWAKWLRPREDQAGFYSPRIGCAVPWHGPSG